MDLNGMQVPLPNTRGQWRYVVPTLNMPDFLSIKITGNGTTVDVDHINIQSSTLLSPPVFKSGNGDTTAYTYAGATVPVTLDLSATDPAAGDVVTYNIDNLPQGARSIPAPAHSRGRRRRPAPTRSSSRPRTAPR